MNHARRKVPIRPATVALSADFLREIENDGRREEIVVARELYERLAGLRLNVGGVHDREASRAEALASDVLEHAESRGGRSEVVLVVGNQTPAEIGRQHLGAPEVLRGKGRLARTRRADEHDKGELGNRELHRLNTANCVGLPTSGSSAPTPSKRTS